MRSEDGISGLVWEEGGEVLPGGKSEEGVRHHYRRPFASHDQLGLKGFVVAHVSEDRCG